MYKWSAEELQLQIGIFFKLYRLRKELSQFQVGIEVGNAKDYIGRIERGETNLTIGIMVKICNFLEVDIKQIVTKANEKQLESIKLEILELEAKLKNKNKKKS
jgi:transcriptional regulator with XRE-family HTH domain